MLKRNTIEYKQIISSLDEEQAHDLAVHLYSTVLLRRIDPEFPSPKWTLWPLPYSEVPDPDDGLHYQDDLIPVNFLKSEPYETYTLFREGIAESKSLRQITRASNQLKLLRGKQKIIDRIATLDGLDPGILTKREIGDRLRQKRFYETRLSLYPTKPKVRKKRLQLAQENETPSGGSELVDPTSSGPGSLGTGSTTHNNTPDHTTNSSCNNTGTLSEIAAMQSSPIGDLIAPNGDDQPRVPTKLSAVEDDSEQARDELLGDETSTSQQETITNRENASSAHETKSSDSVQTSMKTTKKPRVHIPNPLSIRADSMEPDSDTQKDSSHAIEHPNPQPTLQKSASESDSDPDLDYTEDIKLANQRRALKKVIERMATKIKYNIIQDHPNSKGRLLSAIGAEIERNIAKKIRQRVEKGEIREGNTYNASLLGSSTNKAMAVLIASKLDNLLNNISSLQTTARPAATKTWRHVLVAAVESEESPYRLFNISPYEKVYPKCEQLFENICYRYKLENDDIGEESRSEGDRFNQSFDVYKYLEKLDETQGTCRLDKHYERQKWEQYELQTLKLLFYNKLSIQLSVKKAAWYSKGRDLLAKSKREERYYHPRLRYTRRNEGISSADYIRPGLENI